MQFKGLGVPNKYFATQKKQMYIRLHCLQALRTIKLPFQSSRVIFLGRSPAEEHLPGIIQAKECMKKKKHISMVSLNLPPAPLRKGNIQAVDLHHSIGLSATPSSLWPGRELRKHHYLEVPEAAYSIFKVHRLRFPLPLGPGPFPWHDCIVLSQKSLWICSPSHPPS